MSGKILLTKTQKYVLIYVYKEVYKMRTNIVLDEWLLKEALKYSKSHTKKGLIHEALKEFLENRKRKDLRELKGKIKFIEDYDYKQLRKGR